MRSGSICTLVTLAFLAGCDSGPLPPDENGPDTTSTSLPALRTGDTVAGTIATEDSLVTFRYVAEADGWRAIFVQADTGSMNLTVRDSLTGMLLGRAFLHPGSGRNLLNNRSDVFPVTQARAYIVRLQAFTAGTGGPFRLVMHAVDRRPESHSGALDAREVVTEEDLHNSADIDDYRFTSLGIEHVLVYLRTADSLVPAAVTAELRQESTDSLLARVDNAPGYPDPEGRATPRRRLPEGGVYRITVQQGVAPVNPAWRFSGDYRLELYKVNLQPETVAPDLPADTVEGEQIDRRGDIDRFVLSGAPGDLYHVFLQITAESRVMLFHVNVLAGPDTTPVTGRAGVGGGTPLRDGGTGAFTLPASGQAIVEVSAPDSGSLHHRGPYRLFAYGVDPAPEASPAVAVPGDSVSGEDIAFPGDVDTFVIRAPAGRAVQILTTRPPGPDAVNRLRVEARHPGTDSVLRTSAVTEGGLAALGRVSVPAGDSVHVRFSDPPGCFQFIGCVTGYAGPYAFHVALIDSMPELVPSAYVEGDTVTAESIEPIGDVDVYTLSLAAGDTLDVWLNVPVEFAGRAAVSVRLPDGTAWPGFSQDAGGSFMLPLVTSLTGTHLIILEGEIDTAGSGRYEFAARTR